MKLLSSKLLLLFAIIFTSTACNNAPNANKEYQEQVKNDFLQRKDLAQGRQEQLFEVFNQDISTQEREALEFLYAYMPYSDLADYKGDYFLAQVRNAFKAREYFTWGKTIPEDIFRHFVLVYRVNNENLDTARMYIFDEIKDRIKNMSMYDAALEVNHWCHEKVTYRASDSRTSSSLATIKTAFGRCGEESTFTVTAMRAVGIPARQCYTPRWAHTDNNHAWVEVWVDGKWYYLGACEPDAELNMGWFSRPSTRAMMVHSNVFGKYINNEEINFESPLFARVNMLSNYTTTKKITINVVDENSNSIEGAEVKFKLYNHAEYNTIATITTNSNGDASLTTGLGDLLIWACKDGAYNYAKLDVREQDKLSLKLDKKAGKEYAEEFDIYPPSEIIKESNISAEKTANTNKRLKYEDSLRNAYIASFPTKEDTQNIKSETLTPNQIWNFIHKSEGNYEEIGAFIKANAKKRNGVFIFDYLNSYSDKDLRDISKEMLEKHLTSFSSNGYDEATYKKGIMPARIANELVRPWRQFLNEKFSQILGNNINSQAIVEWINTNIAISNDGNYSGCPISPQGVFELRHSDKHSRNIFFIAVCRALNIPAYHDNATRQLFVYENKEWNIIKFEEEKAKAATGELILNYTKKSELLPQYNVHYTIAKFENGDFQTFNYTNDSRVAKFPASLELETGYYLLSTGNRYSDGTTLSTLEFFNIEAGKTTTKEINLRSLTPRNESYGDIDLKHKLVINNKEIEVAELVKDNSLVLAFIDPSVEPTKHVFREMASLKAAYEKWGGNILFVTPSDKQIDNTATASYDLPKQSTFIIDEESAWMNEIISSTNQHFRDNFPLIFIVDKDGKLSFKTEGYRIGTGELILKSIKE